MEEFKMNETTKKLEEEVIREEGTDLVVENEIREEKTKGFLNKAKKAGKYLGVFALGALSYGVLSAIKNSNESDESDDLIVDDYTVESDDIVE